MLPPRVEDLRAERVGDTVLLHWTSPSETTDHIALRGPVSAEICRDLLPASSPGSKAAPASCTVVQTLASPAGDRAVSDPLPASLLAEPSQALAYRVLLHNASGRSAGASDAVLAASGAAPSPVTGLEANSAANGVALTWKAINSSPDTAVQLLRSPLPDRSGSPAPRHGFGASATPLGSSARGDRAPVRLLAVPPGVPDRGGAIDPSAERDRAYSYSATRTRTVSPGGATLTLRSADSASVSVLVHDIAPPAAPTGLVVATDGLSADLSWQPGFEPDLAGYIVYRAELPAGSSRVDGASWQRLTPSAVELPAFHDTLSHAGSFAFRVSAVDRSGNESLPSAPALAEATASVP